MAQVMVDIETLSLNPNALILTIGAVKFDRKSPVKRLSKADTFYRRITMSSCVDVGLDVDKSVADWWKTQSKEAFYEAIKHPDRVPILQALTEFTEWFGNSRLIWSNGDDFDCVILKEAYKACKMETPWKYWNTRDVRTILDVSNVRLEDMPPNAIPHHALHDAYRQVLAVQEAFKRLCSE